MENLFNEKLLEEEIITFTYGGESFSGHEVKIENLISELKGVETLVKEIVLIYKEKHNLSSDDVDFQIYVKFEDGSIKEVIKLVKKNATVLSLAGTFIMPFISSACDYYLNKSDDKASEVGQILVDNKKIRKSIENILGPVSGGDNYIVIQNCNVTYNINYEEKGQIVQKILRQDQDSANLIEVKEESMLGIISASKVYDVSPFNFRIKDTVEDIPISFKDKEFNLHEKQEFLGKELVIKASVTYKGGKRVSVLVNEYQQVNSLFQK